MIPNPAYMTEKELLWAILQELQELRRCVSPPESTQPLEVTQDEKSGDMLGSIPGLGIKLRAETLEEVLEAYTEAIAAPAGKAAAEGAALAPQDVPDEKDPNERLLIVSGGSWQYQRSRRTSKSQC